MQLRAVAPTSIGKDVKVRVKRNGLYSDWFPVKVRAPHTAQLIGYDTLANPKFGYTTRRTVVQSVQAGTRSPFRSPVRMAIHIPQTAYAFTLSNDGASGGTLFDQFIAVPIEIEKLNTEEIGRPVGWGDAAGGFVFFGSDTGPSNSFVEWAADASGSFDVPVGAALPGFSFLTTEQIESPILYALNGALDMDKAVEVSAFPEPATLSLFSFGLTLLVAVVVRRPCTLT